MSEASKFLYERQWVMGGSDVASLVHWDADERLFVPATAEKPGCGFLTRYQLFQKKGMYAETMPHPEDNPSLVMRAGALLEPLVLEEVPVQTGGTIVQVQVPYVSHFDGGLVAAGTLDGVLEHPGASSKVVVECKVTTKYLGVGFGMDQLLDIYPNYFVQVQWYLMLSGFDAAVVALYSVPAHKVYLVDVRADADLIGLLVACAKKFWERHVKTEEPPPLEARDLQCLRGFATPTTKNDISGLQESQISATADDVCAIENLTIASKQKKVWEDRARTAKAHLMTRFRDTGATQIVDPLTGELWVQAKFDKTTNALFGVKVVGND